MEQSTPQFPNRDRIREENEFLKMKLMLERGAQFGHGPGHEEMPPEMEYAFLKQIEEIENDFDNGEMITVYNKIGAPTQFKLPAEIPEDEFPERWEELREFMYSFGIEVCCDVETVPAKELYRFAIEDLFPMEIEDWNNPTTICTFMYELFYPDEVANNTSFVKEQCLYVLLTKGRTFFDGLFSKKGIQLNEHTHLSFAEFNILVERFKLAFDEIRINTLDSTNCIIMEDDCTVEGAFEIVCVSDHEEMVFAGKWKVMFGSDESTDFWQINYVELEGIRF